MAIHLSSPISDLPGIGGAAVKDLRGLGVLSVRDLLWYVPFRYDDFSIQKPIADLVSGDTVTIEAQIQQIKTRPAKNRKLKMTEAILEDDSGEIKAIWFNQPYLEKTLRAGTHASFAGRVEDRYGLQFSNPIHEPVGKRLHTGRIVPVYGLTGSLTIRRLRVAMDASLTAAQELPDWLPRSIRDAEWLPLLSEAIRQVHFPESRSALEEAVYRLKFDELFLHQLLFAEVRRDREQHAAREMSIDEAYLKEMVASLPFVLTNDQKKAAWEIVQDMAKPVPMNRLLEGDVGSGKTVVAALAIGHAVHVGQRAMYLAPTEILARQQFESLRALLPTSSIAILTSGTQRLGAEKIARSLLLKEVAEGSVDVLVGTHALFRQDVSLPDRGLVVIDEQHRFGVQQRHALLESSDETVPHLLSMTATPIPRSLALTVYGDLDLSILREKPKGRKPVATKLVHPPERAGMWGHVRELIAKGQQVFVVCPLIDPSDSMGAKSVKEVTSLLKKTELKGQRLAMLHGKMKAAEKQEVIDQLRAKEVDVLISTTVVEVGVDIPNATVMVITGAERFGLAQLHQLRGRVGRSDLVSYCYLLPDDLTVASEQRLKALESSGDGFALAEKDLELRGAGNVFGNAQSGFPDFQFATPADADVMKKARDRAAELLSLDPELKDFPLVQERIQEALDQVHLE